MKGNPPLPTPSAQALSGPAKTLSLLRALVLSAGTIAPAHAASPALSAVRIGATAESRRITIVLSLPSRDAAGAAELATRVTTPGDPLYHRYLTPLQYAARFGARQADYDAVVAWAKAQGLAIGERYTARTILPVSGSAAALARAIGPGLSGEVNLEHYEPVRDASGRIYYAADGEPHLPEAVAGKVDGVIGLSSAAHFVPQVVGKPAGARKLASGTGPGGAYSAADLRSIYRVPPQGFAGNPQTVGVFEQGGFDPADVATYLKANNLSHVAVRARSVNGSSTGIDDPRVELEAVLDIDMLVGINPAVSKIIVYEDGDDVFQVALLDAFSAMASDHAVRTVSVSYGQDETLQGKAAIRAENTVLTQMAAQGQAVFASAGDDGAYGDQSKPENVSDPSSQPFVTAVGGTTLFTGQDESYVGEEVWNDLGIGAGATGGGISRVWPIPSFQLSGGQSVAVQNHGSATMRNVPDVAAIANPLTGVAVYSALNGGWLTIGGTSVSSPLWAGFYSMVNAATEGLGLGSAGFANPGLYSLYDNQAFLYPHFHDIADGNNGYGASSRHGFTAGYGYDNTTGVGSLNGAFTLLNLVLYLTVANTDPPPAPRDLSAVLTPTTATLSWTGAPADKGFVLLAANYDTGAAAAETVQTGTSAVLTGLTPGTTYYFYVVAVSRGGSTGSAYDIFTTPKAGN